MTGPTNQLPRGLVSINRVPPARHNEPANPLADHWIRSSCEQHRSAKAAGRRIQIPSDFLNSQPRFRPGPDARRGSRIRFSRLAHRWSRPTTDRCRDLRFRGHSEQRGDLALAGASADLLRPARRLLMFASVATLALNVADPLVASEFGKAAFDAVGPLLLIGRAEIGPGFLQAINASGVTHEEQEPSGVTQADSIAPAGTDSTDEPTQPEATAENLVPRDRRKMSQQRPPEPLLEQARQKDAAHRVAHQRPISAETLRMGLGIGAARARHLVRTLRAEYQDQLTHSPAEEGRADETTDTSTTLVA